MSMNKNLMLKAGAGMTALLAATAVNAKPDRPNIILILSDDMGYSDIGCFGGFIDTPNIDALSTEGIKFTQFYNCARSCPSRASLMTGLHPHQAGMGHMTSDKGVPGYRGDINTSCVTIAEVLGASGYETYAYGKWQLTKEKKENQSHHNWPLQRGFDHFYGSIGGAGSFYDPYCLCRDNTPITPDNDPKYRPETYYYTNAITDNILMDLEAREGDDRPFFMYVAYTAAHWPMHALEEDIEPYKGKFDKGWDQLRKEKYQHMVEMGLIPEDWKLTKCDGPSWEDARDQKFEARCMEVYAAMVSNMDRNIGRLVADLEARGELENTIILFLQDNGACAENAGRRGTFDPEAYAQKNVGIEPMKPDELQTSNSPKKTRDGRLVKTGYGVIPGPADTFVGYGKSWANLSNVPFREYKHWVHEGGISTPLLIRWDKGIGNHAGETRVQPGFLPDIMATLVEVSGAEYPKSFNGHEITPCEGMSLVPVFNKDKVDYDRPLFFEHEGNRAMRAGKWKIVCKAQPGDIPVEKWELYDMENDRTETRNLAVEYPEIVAAMVEEWNIFAESSQVKPWPVDKNKDGNKGGNKADKKAKKKHHKN